MPTAELLPQQSPSLTQPEIPHGGTNPLFIRFLQLLHTLPPEDIQSFLTVSGLVTCSEGQITIIHNNQGGDPEV